MKTNRIIAALAVALSAAWFSCAPAEAQNTDTYFGTPGGGGVNGAVGMCLNASNQAVPCSAAGALPGTQGLGVSSCGAGSVVAGKAASFTFDTTGKLCVNAAVTVSGFQGNGNFASLTATASSSASTALPSGGSSTRITNASSTATVSCTFATGAATGVVSNIIVPPLSSVSRVNGAWDHIACIDQTGSTGSNLVVLEGGTGLGNDTGGGGGGSGGATNITQAAGTAINATVAAAGQLPIDVVPGNNLATLIAAATPAGENHIGEIGSNQIKVQVAQTVTASAYSAGNALGGLMTVAGAAAPLADPARPRARVVPTQPRAPAQGGTGLTCSRRSRRSP
jgi:hypothetical protein